MRSELSALLDTSVLSGAAEASLPLSGDWAISTVTLGELHAGILMASDEATKAARLRRLAAMLSVASVLQVDQEVAGAYGELRAASNRAQSNDLWIAATALAHDLMLITHDRRQAALPLVRAELISVES